MTRPPLKVLMLVSSYPRSLEDTASIFLRHLAESLAARDLEMHVLAPADAAKGTRTEKNVRVHRFRYFPKKLQNLAYGSGILSNLKREPWLWIQVPFFFVFMTYSLIRVIGKEHPDLIHAHWIFPQGLIAVLVKYLYGTPVITTAHGTDTFELQGQASNWLKRLVVTRSDAWTSNTLATYEAIPNSASLPRPHVIPMGVHVAFFSSGDRVHLRRELQNDLLVLFVGRLVKEKGCYDLLQAYALLSPGVRARTTLWIIGDGEESAKLQEYAAGLGAGTKVRFWGTISHSRLPDFYAAADLLVVPSLREGQGVIVLEAFAARVCVLATRIGGIAEVINDGQTGVLVDTQDPKQLAMTIQNLLLDGPLRARLEENAFQKLLQRYDWQEIAEQFENLYRKVLQG